MVGYKKYLFQDPVVKGLAETVDNPRTAVVLDNLTRWIDKSISYTPDISTYGFDYIQQPAVTVRYGKGDCQDLTALISSVLYQLHIPYRVVIGNLRDGSKHIWVEVKSDKRYFIDGTGPAYGGIDDSYEKFYGSFDDRIALQRSEWV